MLTSKGSTTYNNDSFTFFASKQCLFMITIYKEKDKSIASYIQNFGYAMPKAIINSKSTNRQFNLVVATLALSLQSRQRLAKVQAKSEAWKSHFMFLRM
jgi:hypothetical protein